MSFRERILLLRRAGALLLALCALVIMHMPTDSFAQRTDAPRDPQTQQGPRETPPAPAPPRSVSFPAPTERRLRNGLRVVVVERPGMPLVSARLMVMTGGEADSSELAGLADMTAELLTKGTRTRTAPQIAEAIEALGGSLSAGARWDASFAEVNVSSSQFEPALRILADVIRNPTFAAEEIERLRQQNLDELNIAMGQPRSLASMVAARVVFGDSPYGHNLSGTLESLARIRREDIARLHSTYYRPDNAVLVIGGNIRATQAFQFAERLFGDWPKPASALPTTGAQQTAQRTTPASRTSVTPPPAGNTAGQSSAANAATRQRVVVIDKPDAAQAAVFLVSSGIRRTDPDYYRAMVANSVLGGGYSARLNQEIRIKRGLSYGAGSRLDVRREVGPFVAQTQTKNESGAEVAGLLISELGRLASEPIPDTELTPRRAALIGNFARNLETTGGLVEYVSSLALYGVNFSEMNSYISSVQGITSNDVQRFAGARLSPGSAHIIIVGNAREFIEPLRRQFPNVEVIPVAELDLNSARLRRAAGTNAPRQEQ